MKNVKKVISVLMVGILLLSFSSCGKDDKSKHASKDETITETNQEFTELKIKTVNTIACGYSHIVALKNDGTVIATGKNEYGECDVSTWNDIVSISAASCFTVGLKNDGTVIATGENMHNQCNINDWTDITFVTAVEGGSVIGIKKDGTVVASGEIVKGNSEDGYLDVNNISNVVACAANEERAVFIRADGTVFAVGDNSYGTCNVSDWTDIVKVSLEYSITVGLKKDGTVVAVGNNSNGRIGNIQEYKNIIDIDTEEDFIEMIDKEGNFLSTYDGEFPEGIGNGNAVAIYGDDNIIILLSNGTVKAFATRLDVSQFTDIKMPY